MWNDTDIPLAYLITFRCYGTWLHGDERGSIDRFHNRYKSPYVPPNERWRQHNARSLKSEPVTLDHPPATAGGTDTLTTRPLPQTVLTT
jgi:hypothetical protein